MKSYDSYAGLATQLSPDFDLVYRPKINVPYTTIVNRAQIPDLANDLAIRGPNERICTQDIYEIQNESGPLGEKVWGVKGDRDGLVRLYGADWYSESGGYGSEIRTASSSNNYIEITFFGTGLNILACNNNAAAIYATIDGGTEGSNFYPTLNNILGGRSYTANIVIPVTSNIGGDYTPRLHTIKIRSAASSFMFAGYEILNEQSTFNCRPGTYLAKSKMYTKAAASTLSFKPDAYVSGGNIKGACVTNYENLDGSLAQVYTAVPSSPILYNSGTPDHTNEEMTRYVQPREFGCGRTDDFSSANSNGNYAFTLDDGTTTLVAYQGAFFSGMASVFGLTNQLNTSFTTLTFVGSGIDVVLVGQTSGTWYNLTVYLDGVSLGNLTGTSTVPIIMKMASGLPYGTHTLKFLCGSTGSTNTGLVGYKVYAPKTPTIPTTAKELSKYYVLANYAVRTSNGYGIIGTGYLRKQITVREAIYTGTGWTMSSIAPNGRESGFSPYTTTANDTVTYTFYGTGYSFAFNSNNSARQYTMTLDGSTVFTSFTTSTSTGISFNTSNGQITGAVNAWSSYVNVNGITEGKHTLSVRYDSGDSLDIQNLDIITPIHFPKIQTDGMKQNTLPVGSCSLGDLRKTWLQASAANKVRAVASLVTAGTISTTSSSYVPIADMSLTVNSPGGDFLLGFYIPVQNGSSGSSTYLQFFVDGVETGQPAYGAANASGQWYVYTANHPVYLSQGTHKVDIYWKSASSVTISNNTAREMWAIEL